MLHVIFWKSCVWQRIYILSLLCYGCNALLAAEQLNSRTKIPAAIVVPPSQDWDGSDGPWSSFALQIGSPPQSIKTFVSTASTQTWAVAPEGCISTDPKDCPDTRGRLYNYNQSSSWVPNLTNATTQIYELGLEGELGYQGVGRYGFDNITLGYKGMGGPTLLNQTIASISTTDFWLGIFGVNPRPSNFTNFNDPIPSFLSNLRSRSFIPSISWAYTAGNQYRFNYVLGSLTLGGYDSAKFIPNSLSWDMAPDDDRDLVVQIEGISTGAGNSLLPEAIPAFLDTTVPYIYLPVAACGKFEKAFGLVWDNATELYLLNDTQHNELKTRNPNITFTIGNLTSATKVEITFPYSAFDLTVTYPLVTNPTKYFPLKRAEKVEQYTLGRTFFQEAYVIADYDRRNFSVSQCNWAGEGPQSIVAIIPPTNETFNGTTDGMPNGTPGTRTKEKSLPISAIAGGASGGGVLIICVILLSLFFRHKKKEKKAAEEKSKAAAEIVILKPELDGYERVPRIYETGPEVDINGDAKYFVPSVQAVEIGESGRNSPVFEMVAEEVAAEMSGVGKEKSTAEKREASLDPRSPSPGDPPTERAMFLDQHRGILAESLVSCAVSLGSVTSSAVSPTSTFRGGRSEPRKPQSAVTAVSPNSLMYTDKGPVDEWFYNRSGST